MKNKNNASFFNDGSFIVKDVIVLNCFSLDGVKTKTKGTSNKQYYLEINCRKTDNATQMYCSYGAAGSTQTSYWCEYDTYEEAKKEFDKIVKSKKRKGYKEIDVAQRALGSDEAKQITKAVDLKNADGKSAATSKLHPETSRIISSLMGSTNNWVIKTLRCPLGQLSNGQIDKGRACLDEAKKTSNKARIHELTNDFYALIPHNLGSGSRGKMTQLLLDSKEKIDQKEYDLDTLLDAKAIGATLVSNSVDDQYNSLDTNFEFVDRNSDLFKWLDLLIQKTKAHNHKQLGKIVLLNAWDIQRKGEKELFLKRAAHIAKECGKQVFPNKMEQLVKGRPGGNSKLHQQANVIPLFHGTRTQNITGILKKGMLIRPSGVVITGAMYGNSLYWGMSSKSINYSSIKSSYWAGGNDDKAFLFVGDCILGNQKVASGAYQYSEKNIKPHHSVWAKGGVSGVINDEFMTYRTDQHNIRHLLEFTCKRD